MESKSFLCVVLAMRSSCSIGVINRGVEVKRYRNLSEMSELGMYSPISIF